MKEYFLYLLYKKNGIHSV